MCQWSQRCQHGVVVMVVVKNSFVSGAMSNRKGEVQTAQTAFPYHQKDSSTQFNVNILAFHVEHVFLYECILPANDSYTLGRIPCLL